MLQKKRKTIKAEYSRRVIFGT